MSCHFISLHRGASLIQKAHGSLPVTLLVDIFKTNAREWTASGWFGSRFRRCGSDIATRLAEQYFSTQSDMNNPFPGMNPYLEEHWRDVHTSLVTYTRDQLQRKLPPGLVARAEEGVSVDDTGEPLTYWPDVQVKELGRKSADALHEPAVPWNGETEVMEPVLIVSEPETERWVEIRDASGRLVTALEVLSPANKSAAGLRAYREKRTRFLAGGANFVEIDLLREGRDALGLPWNIGPAQQETVYRVCVRRASRPQQAELYNLPLRRRLPGIRVPLRESDQDVVLAMQPLVDLCFENGGYAGLDFSRDPEPPLATADAQWLDDCLRRSGLRK